MTTIAQEPVNIGPVPRCVKVPDDGSLNLFLVITLIAVYAISYPLARYSELGRAIHKIKKGEKP